MIDPLFKENVFRERLNQQSKSQAQVALEEQEALLGEEIYKKLWKHFESLCPKAKKPMDKWEPHLANLTLESFEKKLPLCMQNECEWLVKQMWRLLSDDCDIARVYFKTYIERIYTPLFSKDPRVQMGFIFKLLDTDSDGILKASDLTKCAEQLNIDAQFGREVQMLMDHYTKTHLKIKTKPKTQD